jgi:signal transduction histidine kinase
MVQVRARAHDEHVIIDVEDECGGLPPGAAEKLFGAFFQAGRDRSGFGLGLAIARQAIEGHGGTLSIENRPSKGCVFTASVPVNAKMTA